MKIEKNGFASRPRATSMWASTPTALACERLMRHAHTGMQSTETMTLREERAEQPADTMQAAPMLGGLIYEAVMERNSMRARNDALRQTFTGGRVVVSPGVLSLPPQANAEVLERVRSFSAFDAENDPYHDFGRFDLAGVTYVFEVDCFARDIHGLQGCDRHRQGDPHADHHARGRILTGARLPARADSWIRTKASAPIP